MDYSEISRELVRHVRGDRSQIQVSRRLGYRSNAAYSWESGRRAPSATDWFALADRPSDPLALRMERFYKRPPDWLDDEPGSLPWVARFVADIRGSTPIRTLAERSGLSRFTLSRWLSGRADPRLPDLLCYLDAAGGRLLDFVAVFAPPDELPSTRRAWRRLEGARALARASPWAQVVLLALELEAYRQQSAHDTAWLADRLGLPLHVVSESLEHLQGAGQIRRVGAHFVPVEVLTVNLRSPGSGNELRRHWAHVAADRLDDPDAMVSYNLFTVSEPVLEQLRALQRAHYKAIRSLVATSEQADQLVLLNLHVIPLG